MTVKTRFTHSCCAKTQFILGFKRYPHGRGNRSCYRYLSTVDRPSLITTVSILRANVEGGGRCKLFDDREILGGKYVYECSNTECFESIAKSAKKKASGCYLQTFDLSKSFLCCRWRFCWINYHMWLFFTHCVFLLFYSSYNPNFILHVSNTVLRNKLKTKENSFFAFFYHIH